MSVQSAKLRLTKKWNMGYALWCNLSSNPNSAIFQFRERWIHKSSSQFLYLKNTVGQQLGCVRSSWMLKKLRECALTRQRPRALKTTDMMRKKWKVRIGRWAFISQSGLRIAWPASGQNKAVQEENGTLQAKISPSLTRWEGERQRPERQRHWKRRPKKPRGGLRDEDGFNYPIKGHWKCHSLSVK